MTEHRIFVAGVVRPQGSLSLWKGRDGKERAKYSDTTVIWRQILHGALATWWDGRAPLTGPIGVTLLASFTRPKGHRGTGRNAGTVRASAPVWHTTYPDADKSARAVGDSLVDAGVIVDDCLIAAWEIQKIWCEVGGTPGALITVEELQ